MPLEPTTPESKPVQTTENKDITHFHVTDLNIHIDPNDAAATSVDVTWAEGYMESTIFVVTKTNHAHLAGPGVITKITEVTDGVSTVYDEVKSRVWEMLQDEGLVPAGDIT